MTSSLNSQLDKDILSLRLAVINATLKKLRLVPMPILVRELLELGISENHIYQQVLVKQPLLIKVRIHFWKVMRFFLACGTLILLFL